MIGMIDQTDFELVWIDGISLHRVLRHECAEHLAMIGMNENGRPVVGHHRPDPPGILQI
jgi:hypothetical protein